MFKRSGLVRYVRVDSLNDKFEFPNKEKKEIWFHRFLKCCLHIVPCNITTHYATRPPTVDKVVRCSSLHAQMGTPHLLARCATYRKIKLTLRYSSSIGLVVKWAMFKRSGLVRNVRVDSLILAVIFLEGRLYYYWILMFDKWFSISQHTTILPVCMRFGTKKDTIISNYIWFDDNKFYNICDCYWLHRYKMSDFHTCQHTAYCWVL